MRRSGCRGLSLVELMVGLVLALLVAAAAGALFAAGLRDDRRLLLEARVDQDLRGAAGLIAREIRRAGYWAHAASAGLWSPAGGHALPNPYDAVSSPAASPDTIELRYSQDTVENDVVDSNEQRGFRLRSGAISVQLGAGNWQTLTDADTLLVTRLDIASGVQEAAMDLATPACAPRAQVRSAEIVIAGRATADPAVQRTVRTTVRMRNDRLLPACEP
jgi:type IV pilus assembly protein PilW